MIIWPFTTRTLKKDFEGRLIILPYGTLNMNGWRVYGKPLAIYRYARTIGASKVIMDSGEIIDPKTT